jgi:hypothetical protein
MTKISDGFEDFIEEKIKELRESGFKSWKAIRELIERIVREVENLDDATGEEKKELAKQIFYAIIDCVPINFCIPIPQFLVKRILKLIIGKVIDRVVKELNERGIFCHKTG